MTKEYWQPTGRVIIEEKAGLDIYQLAIDKAEPGQIDFLRLGEERVEEEDYFRSEPVEATQAFSRNRKRVEESLVRLVRSLWEHYDLPRDGIIEYGSGATGYFDAVLRPEDITNWLQAEVNPLAIMKNRGQNPDASIVEGSYYQMGYRNVPMITGLSSFDTAGDLPYAIEQVAQALQKEGYFLHIQDVRPADNCVAQYLKRAYGEVPKQAFTSDEFIFGFPIGDKRLTTVDLFRDAIGEAITNHPGLELVTNSFHTLQERLEEQAIEYYFLNLYGRLEAQMEEGKRTTTILVTLAKKK